MALERQRPGHRAQPGALALVGGGAGKGVAGRAHGRDEDLGARAVGQCQRGAGVVDEQLLAGAPVPWKRRYRNGCAVAMPFKAKALDAWLPRGE